MRIKLIKEQKMNYMSDACWDPSGKFFLTTSNNTKTYMIWNSFGKMIHKDTILKDISAIEWRPRPTISVSDHKIKEITKNFDKICK